jgi:peptide/nickel transport system permease protein
LLRFLARRLAFGVVVMWAVATFVFILYFVTPHNVARAIAGTKAPPEVVATIRDRLGLNQPIIEQYFHYFGRLLHGHLGYSYVNSEPVSRIILNDLPITASLAVGGAVIWLIIGISTGVLAATRPRGFLDRSTTTIALFFYSMPTFLLGLLFILLLYYRLHLAGVDIFPPGGYTPITESVWGWLHHMILPWFTVALVSASTYTRLTRASMLEVLGEDYIRTARSKGMRESRVIYRHGLRAGLTPVVTQFGIDFGILLGGVILTEKVFGLPGLGQQIANSVPVHDIPMIIALVLLASALVIVANIVVDALYAVLDPRVRLS